MYSFTITDITAGATGPVLHMTSERGTKLEMYLAEKSDVPPIGHVMVLLDAAAIAELKNRIEELINPPGSSPA